MLAVSAKASSAAPTGFTLDSMKVRTKVPHLMRGNLYFCLFIYHNM